MRVRPTEIILVTFTNKAAAEMKERVERLIGPEKARQILMGTFHATCMHFLRRHHAAAGLDKNFLISDPQDNKQVMKRLIEQNSFDLSPDYVLNFISRCKNNGHNHTNFFRATSSYDDQTLKIKKLFEDYERYLRESALVDFDDLLVHADRLFATAPQVLEQYQHILVDEFQDTNTLQYSLTKRLAHRENLFVVGDPDQSIYAWRNANVDFITLQLKADFPATFRTHHLEMNYRSTGNILKASQLMMNQEKTRERRAFRTDNFRGSPITLRVFKDAKDETAFIATEVVRLMSTLKPLLEYSDFSILVRTNAMTPNIEEALVLAKIPYKVIGDIKFFDRAEVKDLVAYLRLVENPKDQASFERVVNVPPREVGKVSLAAILSCASSRGLTCLEVCRKLASGETFSGMEAKRLPIASLGAFVKIIDGLTKTKRTATVSSLIKKLIADTGYRDYLKKKYSKEWEGRWENIQELINYTSRFDSDESQSQSQRSQQTPSTAAMILSPGGTTTAGGSQPSLSQATGAEDDGPGFLSKFLELAVLSSGSDDKAVKCVSVSTIHSAKGLEWPCVFILGIEEGSIPHSRSLKDEESVREERRLLYVGMTRAQCFLYLTASNTRWSQGGEEVRTISRFLQVFNHDDLTEVDSMLWSTSPPQCTGRTALLLEQMLGRTKLAERGVVGTEDVLQPSPNSKRRMTRTSSTSGGRRFPGPGQQQPQQASRKMTGFEDEASGSDIEEQETEEKSKEESKPEKVKVDPATQQFSSFVSATSVLGTRKTTQPVSQAQPRHLPPAEQQFSSFAAAKSLRQPQTNGAFTSARAALAAGTGGGGNPKSSPTARNLFKVQELFSIVTTPAFGSEGSPHGDKQHEAKKTRTPPAEESRVLSPSLSYDANLPTSSRLCDADDSADEGEAITEHARKGKPLTERKEKPPAKNAKGKKLKGGKPFPSHKGKTMDVYLAQAREKLSQDLAKFSQECLSSQKSENLISSGTDLLTPVLISPTPLEEERGEKQSAFTAEERGANVMRDGETEPPPTLNVPELKDHRAHDHVPGFDTVTKVSGDQLKVESGGTAVQDNAQVSPQIAVVCCVADVLGASAFQKKKRPLSLSLKKTQLADTAAQKVGKKDSPEPPLKKTLSPPQKEPENEEKGAEEANGGDDCSESSQRKRKREPAKKSVEKEGPSQGKKRSKQEAETTQSTLQWGK